MDIYNEKIIDKRNELFNTVKDIKLKMKKREDDRANGEPCIIKAHVEFLEKKISQSEEKYNLILDEFIKYKEMAENKYNELNNEFTKYKEMVENKNNELNNELDNAFKLLKSISMECESEEYKKELKKKKDECRLLKKKELDDWKNNYENKKKIKLSKEDFNKLVYDIENGNI